MNGVYKAKQLQLLVLGFLFMSSGCASLRPPAEDRAVWLRQQEQAGISETQEKQPANLLYPLVTGLEWALP